MKHSVSALLFLLIGIGATSAQGTSAPQPACMVPPATSGDAVFMGLAAGSGSYMANRALGDPSKATKASRVLIEEGGSPVDLALLSLGSRHLWLVEGAKDRVRSVTVLGGGDDTGGISGVTGVAKEMVRFIPAAPCLSAVKAALASSARSELDAMALTGRTGKILYKEVVRDLSMPSGSQAPQVDVTRLQVPNFPEPLAREVKRIMSGRMTQYSVLRLDGLEIVSKSPVVEPETLPGYLGIEQLQANGSIEVRTVETGHAWFDVVLKRAVKIPQGFEGPAGLGIRALVLREGIPLPDNVDRICVLDEKTGYPLSGPMMNSSICEMAYLPGGRGPGGKAACFASPTPEGTELVFAYSDAGGIESPVSVTGNPQRKTYVQRVVVEPGDRPIHLVLASQYPRVIVVEGAAERVARLTAMQVGEGFVAPAGVVGLPPEKFEVAYGQDCPRGHPGANRTNQVRFETTMRDAMGKAPDLILARQRWEAYGYNGREMPSSFAVPSGREMPMAARPYGFPEGQQVYIGSP